MTQEEESKITPLEEQRREALEHYNKASVAVHHWSSFVEAAIKAYNPTPTADAERGAEEILFKHWKKWMEKIHVNTEELTMTDMVEDTSWLFFIDAMHEFSYLQNASRDNLIKALDEYIGFLGKEFNRIAPYLQVHGQAPAPEDIEEGKRRRAEIQELRKQLN